MTRLNPGEPKWQLVAMTITGRILILYGTFLLAWDLWPALVQGFLSVVRWLP